MKTIKDYISEAENLINEYKAFSEKRNAFYDENVSNFDLDLKVYTALQKWCKMIDEENIIIRKAIKAVKNCYRLFGIEIPKVLDEYNMEDKLLKFKWLVDDIDNKIRQYYRF